MFRLAFLALCLTFPMVALGQSPRPTVDATALRMHAFNNGGDPKRGEALFFNESVTKCSTCHKARGHGGDVGPDLSQIGGKFDRVHLVESILEPSAQILQGYRTTTLERSDGRVVSGIVKEETAEAITLADATGRRRTVRKADVEDRRLDKVSLMPDGFGRALSPTEFTDLIAYL